MKRINYFNGINQIKKLAACMLIIVLVAMDLTFAGPVMTMETMAMATRMGQTCEQLSAALR